MSEKIKIVLIKRNMTLKDLADKINTSSQNLSNKIRRDNFTEKELVEIAAILDCTFNATFTMNDTKETF